MTSAYSDTWWSIFLDQHGRDSEEEAAFLGYLTTQGIDPGSAPGVLQSAYDAFVVFMDESGERAAADPGPSAEELAKQQAVVALQTVTVPRSRTSNPLVQKPQTAATRPKALRDKSDEAAAPGPAPSSAPPASGTSPTTSEGGSDEGPSQPGLRRR